MQNECMKLATAIHNPSYSNYPTIPPTAQKHSLAIHVRLPTINGQFQAALLLFLVGGIGWLEKIRISVNLRFTELANWN